MIVIPKIDSSADSCKWQKKNNECVILGDLECRVSEFSKSGASNDANAKAVHPTSLSRVDAVEDPLVETHLLSQLVSKDVMQRCRVENLCFRKTLGSWLQLNDHIRYFETK